MPDFRFPIGSSGQVLVLTQGVLAHFENVRQNEPSTPEAGGQLFASLSSSEIVIEEATGPRRSDRRGRFHYEPDRQAERREITAMHNRRLHYVGDWHTHPERMPSPSQRDLSSISECAQKSSHGLNGFLLIVIGTAPFPEGLHISVHGGKEQTVLKVAQAPNAGLQAEGEIERARLKNGR